jgi:hypothetical protein
VGPGDHAVTGIARLPTAIQGTLRIAWGESPGNALLLAKKLMVALIVLVVVLFAVAVFAVDHTLKARKKARLRRNAEERLTAAAAGAETRERDRRARQEASAALTSVMPAIADRGPRRV